MNLSYRKIKRNGEVIIIINKDGHYTKVTEEQAALLIDMLGIAIEDKVIGSVRG